MGARVGIALVVCIARIAAADRAPCNVDADCAPSDYCDWSRNGALMQRHCLPRPLIETAAQRRRRRLLAAGIALTAVGGAALLFGAMGVGIAEDISNRYAPLSSEAQSQDDQGRDAGIGLLVFGGAMAIAGITLMVLETRQSP
jgi:hypothetical protein